MLGVRLKGEGYTLVETLKKEAKTRRPLGGGAFLSSRANWGLSCNLIKEGSRDCQGGTVESQPTMLRGKHSAIGGEPSRCFIASNGCAKKVKSYNTVYFMDYIYFDLRINAICSKSHALE